MYISGIRYTSAALSLYLKNRRSIFILSATNLVIFTGTDGVFPQKNHLSPYLFIFRYSVAGLIPSSSAAFFLCPLVA